MSESITLHLTLQELRSGSYLGEGLLFPEVSRFGGGARSVERALAANCQEILKKLEALEFHRRHSVGEPRVGEIAFELAPPAPTAAWERPMPLVFHYLAWRHGDRASLAFVPALGIEAIAAREEHLQTLLEKEIRSCLYRKGALGSLPELYRFQQCRGLRVLTTTVRAPVRPPRQRQEEYEKDEAEKKSVLAEIGEDLTAQDLTPAYECEALVAQLAEAFTGRRPVSVLLVGPSGCGKTAVVRELVRRRKEFGLARRGFWATTGSRIVAGQSGFGMWQERCVKICREASATKAVLLLGNLVELREVGKGEHQSQGIASFFKPSMQRGEVVAVAECTPDQLDIVERDDPALLQAFRTVRVGEPDAETAHAILLSCAALWEGEYGVGVQTEALEEVDRLHRRYASCSVFPGRPLRFMENLFDDAAFGGAGRAGAVGRKPEITPESVRRFFSRETGLPALLLDEEETLDLAAVRAWFAERLIGQGEAVSLVTDLIAVARAGLGRSGKPIASMLFLGPTGVGKTELAKVLAEFFFGSCDRLTRFDMSEYADPLAVMRLTGGGRGGEGRLTAALREQPFSVVLLDEIEKAHPQLFDLMLQVLGEGRLTDSWGRVADFSNALVIMTSNLGAEVFRRRAPGLHAGGADGSGGADWLSSVMTEVRGFFRPEFVNRIDRIVPFHPLDRGTLHSIAARQLEALARRDGILYRKVALEVGDGVAGHLAAAGWDPRYGARPLRRAVERSLLAPLAAELNRHGRSQQLGAVVAVNDGALEVEVHSEGSTGEGTEHLLTGDSAERRESVRIGALRRRAFKVVRGMAVLSLANDIARLERLRKKALERTGKGRRHDTPDADQPRLPLLRSTHGAIRGAWARILEEEERALLGLYGHRRGGQGGDGEALPDCDALDRGWEDACAGVYSLEFANPDQITLAIYGEHLATLYELGLIYYRFLREIREFEVRIETLQVVQKEGLKRALVLKPERFFEVDPQNLIGMIFTVAGRRAHPLLVEEGGRHKITHRGEERVCIVECSGKIGEACKLPAGVERRGFGKDKSMGRSYLPDERVLHDTILGRRFHDNGRFHETLDEAVEEGFRARVYVALTGNE